MKTNRVPVRAFVYPLFFFSGMSALMYEVIWMKELTLIMGNTVQSTSAVLAAFMGGLAVGSLFFGRLVDRLSFPPLLSYALLELIIGVFAVAFPFLMGGFQVLYVALHHQLGLSLQTFTILRFAVSFLVLLVPTILMGATLPVLSKFVEEGYHNIGRKIGLLYAVNTLGAVFGILITGYVLLGLSGIKTTTSAAIMVNLLVALLAFLLWMREGKQAMRGSPSPAETQREDGLETVGEDLPLSPRKMALVAYLLSGFLALGYEVLWMRSFIPFLHSSTYSFSTMLAAFLTGLALGSWVFSRFADRWNSALNVLGWSQIGIGGLSLASLFSFLLYYRLFSSRLDLPLHEMTLGSFLIAFSYFFVILIPPCLLMGGVFPLVVKIVSRGSTSRIGTRVGDVYFANTLGAIAGSAITCFVLIPNLGVRNSLILMIFMNLCLGLTILYLSGSTRKRWRRIPFKALFIGVVVISVALLSENVFVTVLKERLRREVGENRLIYYREGSTATVSVVELERNRVRLLLVNSIIITGKFLTTKLMAHLPVLLHPDPRKALVICFGMGTTFRSLAAHGVEVQGVELVPEEIETFPLFYKDAEKLLKDPRLRITINDGRNHLLLTQEKYDVITVDPSPPLYSSGMVNLYTPEFYRLCRDRLTARGVMSMWFFLPSCRTSEFQMLLKSFMQVFPHTTIWKSPHVQGIYVIGTKEKLTIDREDLRQRILRNAVQRDVSGFLRKGVPFDENYLLGLFMFNSRRAWTMAKGGLNLSDDTPYIEHPLVTWWFDPTRLDVELLFAMEKDSIEEYVVASERPAISLVD